ncbi:uncharacterized protein C8orf74 homolog [Ornithorhynchus anatinus]|uniref:uncharacterized protein C8orf74 homolog n=1 Tax=Ornithorhynchus anatinus TaxID=9258 RepID=UPI0010A8BF9E|nr:uncharacterized protein C8orf74 homolog [Ornithorhynchus anatinus]
MASLSAQDVERIFSLQEEEGRQCLRSLLQGGDHPRQDILADIYYDSLIFAGEEGFPWSAVAEVVSFIRELLEETRGVSLASAVAVLGDRLRNAGAWLSPSRLGALCAYVHHTYLCHFRLYQLVLVQAPEEKRATTRLQLCLPPQPAPLAEGTDRDSWLHRQRLAELSQEEAEILSRPAPPLLETEQALKEAQEELGVPGGQGLEREVLESLVRGAVGARLGAAGRRLQAEVEVAMELLQLRVRRKALSLCAPPPSPPPRTRTDPGKAPLPRNRKN